MAIAGDAVAGAKRRVQFGNVKTDAPIKRRNPIMLQAAVLAQEWLTRERLTGAVSREEQSFLEMFIADMEVG